MYVKPNIEATLSSSIHLQCVSPVCLPVCEVEWYKRDQQLFEYRNGSRIVQGRVSSTLQIENFQLQDVGNYYCVAVNTMSKKMVKSNNITVKIKSKFLKNSSYIRFIVLNSRKRLWLIQHLIEKSIVLC